MNLIYQYWDGNWNESIPNSIKEMKSYAKRIGADYIFDKNPRVLHNHFKTDVGVGDYWTHYSCLRPVFDRSFDKYEKTLYVDLDIFPVDGLTENIFDDFHGEIGICTEPEQPRLRRKTACHRVNHENDEKYAKMCKDVFGVDLPRNRYGIDVFNCGLEMFSREGRIKARKLFNHPKEYFDALSSIEGGINPWYYCDQPYFTLMMFLHDFDVQLLDNGWNSYVHYYRAKGDEHRTLCDWRDANTKFVHCQFLKSIIDNKALWKIVNLPKESWNLHE